MINILHNRMTTASSWAFRPTEMESFEEGKKEEVGGGEAIFLELLFCCHDAKWRTWILQKQTATKSSWKKSTKYSNKMGLWCAMWLLYGMAQLRISTTFQFYAATLIILVRLCPKDPHGTKKQWQIPLQHRRRRNTEHTYQQSLYSISFVFLTRACS